MARHRNSVLIRQGRQWLGFDQPEDIVVAHAPGDVLPAMGRVEKAVGQGLFAAGFITYEAAPGFDRALPGREGGPLPLVWFGLYSSCRRWAHPPGAGQDGSCGPWTSSIGEAEHAEAMQRIRALIRAGDTYQVNYTLRLRASFEGDPYGYFLALIRAQQQGPFAYVRTASHALCSASPERFFELRQGRIDAHPMKGTAPRGLTVEEDEAKACALAASPKNRAENVMIVDMIRNDLGRIAVPGSVRVPRLFDVERYPTVWQMTSRVAARTDASLSSILKAVFPCASITGAPKVRTMQIIRDLEPDPRGVYTGSIGWVAPAAGGRMAARFNVAIRTVVIDHLRGTAEYGVGGGIVWDSQAREEYAECLAKAAVLTFRRPPFELLETLLWSAESGFFLLEGHLDRLRRSASFFGFRCPEQRIRQELAAGVATADEPSLRVRLRLDETGRVRVETTPFAMSPERPVWRVRLADRPVDRTDPFLYHKTTHRQVYEQARQSAPGWDDVILFNTDGMITESTVANIVCEGGGRRITPPVSCGLLDGVYRRHLVTTGAITEQAMTIHDLYRADAVFLINSVRKWIRVDAGW